MAIKRIKVKNFKSFDELDLELRPFNVVIGANASGKSNFTQIFKFLKDAEENDLKNAVALNAGMESLRNLTIGSSRPVSLEVVLDTNIAWGEGEKGLRVNEIQYSFCVDSQQEKNGLRITKDQLVQKFEMIQFGRAQKELFESDVLAHGTCILSSVDGKLNYEFDPPDIVDDVNMHIPILSFTKASLPPNILLIKTPFSLIPPWEGLFAKTMIYNFDPHLARNPAQITGKAELQRDGGNLALALDQLLEDEENRRKFCNLLKDLLPFVDDIGTEKFAEKSLLMTLRENYYEGKDLRAYLLSDGTINIVALLIALYFEDKNVVVIEEPERHIHPHLISRVVDMMKDASRNKQIIVTTHSPEIVKYAGLENLLLAGRGKDGFSRITRPEEKEHLRGFLESELGLDELYVQNILAT
mgnify:CR=1 FL=1